MLKGYITWLYATISTAYREEHVSQVATVIKAQASEVLYIALIHPCRLGWKIWCTEHLQLPEKVKGQGTINLCTSLSVCVSVCLPMYEYTHILWLFKGWFLKVIKGLWQWRTWASWVGYLLAFLLPFIQSWFRETQVSCMAMCPCIPSMVLIDLSPPSDNWRVNIWPSFDQRHVKAVKLRSKF